MNVRIRWDGLVWAILGMGLCAGSIRLGLGNLHNPGPGFLAFLSGAALGILGLAGLWSAFERPLEASNAAIEKFSTMWSWRRLLGPVLTLFILIAYILLWRFLGFVLTTFICLFLLFKLSEPRKWLMPFALTALAVISSYLLFSVWLKAQFPRGIFGF